MAKLVKKPRIELTQIDRLAFDPEKGCADDIAWWAELYFDGITFPWQKYFYHYPCKDKMAIVGIRGGKTYGVARAALHKGMFVPGLKFLNTSISTEQAKLVYYAMLEMLYTDRIQHWVEDIQRSPYPIVKLINGSTYDFRSIGYEAELLRGNQWDWINIDEAAYVTSEIAVNTLRGRLLGFNQQRGQPLMGWFWQVTTPKGKTNWLFKRWKKGDPRYDAADPNRYLSLRARTTDNTMLDAEMIREIMQEYTEREIQQELMGDFLDATDTEFDLEQLMLACSEAHPEVRELYAGIESWRQRFTGKKNLKAEFGLTEDIDHYELAPLPGRQYIASWDLGKKPTKTGRNATVGMVWDVTEVPWKMVAYRYEPGTSYLMALGMIESWQDKYSSAGTKAYTVIDATGKGDVLNEIIELENQTHVEGIVYSNILKPNLITAGKIAIERGLVRYPFIRRMIDQLSTYTQFDDKLAQDIVMCFCQAMYKARELTGVSMARPSIQGLSHVYRRTPLALNPYMHRSAQRRRGARTGRAS